jgi:hypothetical protein
MDAAYREESHIRAPEMPAKTACSVAALYSNTQDDQNRARLFLVSGCKVMFVLQ